MNVTNDAHDRYSETQKRTMIAHALYTERLQPPIAKGENSFHATIGA